MVELISFEGVAEFDKKISLIFEKVVPMESKWILVRLGDICEIKNGGTPNTKNQSYWNGNINWATLVDTKNKYLVDTKRKITETGVKHSSAVLLPINTVIFSSRATIGDVCINKVETCTNQGYKNFICNGSQIHYEYLYHILKNQTPNILKLASGMTYPEIPKTRISNFKVSLPPIDIQEKIITEMKKIEEKAKTFVVNNIDELRNEILKKYL